MANYGYIARDLKGKKVKGSLMAQDMPECLNMLKTQWLYGLFYWEEDDGLAEEGHKMKLKDVVIFCRQLAAMLAAGVSIVQALYVLHEKAVRPAYKQIMLKLYEMVQKGNSLSDAMAAQNKVFPKLLINMVESGEMGGTLDEIMLKMADHYEKENNLKNKIRTASIYPIALSVISLGIVILLLTVVFPIFVDMFDGMALPGPTQFLLDVSNLLKTHWIMVILIIAGTIVGVRILMRVPRIKREYDHMKLRLPIIGKLQRTIYTARCSRNLATLYTSGISTLQSVIMTAKILDNRYISEHMASVAEDLKVGLTLGNSLEKTAIFDPMFTSMVHIGEEAGELDSVLNKTADYFDDEAESAMKNMVALMEPIMIVTLGIIVGFIVVSIMLPIFGMYSNLSV